MRKILLSVCTILLFFSSMYSQKVVEVEGQVVSQLYLDAMDALEEMTNETYTETIDKVVNEMMPKIEGLYERFNIYLWGLAFESARLEQYSKLYDLIKIAQQENIYFPFRDGERQWPGFISELNKLDGFDAWIKRNNELREIDQKNAVAEYIIQLPTNYTEEKTYPLVIVLTGGFGSHVQLAHYWQSEGFEKHCIVAYLMGSFCQGSFLRSHPRGDYSEIINTFRQVSEKYAVDTTKLIMAGQSAGGHKSTIIALDEILPVKGLLLAFPVKPRELSEEKIKSAVERGVKAAILTGENDANYLKGQIELAHTFNNYDLPTRFLIFPEVGHWYPPEFGVHIEKSLDFILQN